MNEAMSVKHLKTCKGASLLLEAWQHEYDDGPILGTRCREEISPQPTGSRGGDSRWPTKSKDNTEDPKEEEMMWLEEMTAQGGHWGRRVPAWRPGAGHDLEGRGEGGRSCQWLEQEREGKAVGSARWPLAIPQTTWKFKVVITTYWS